MKQSPLFWPARITGSMLSVLDETGLPSRQRFLKVADVAGAVRVIRQMKTRAFGQLLVVLYAFILVARKNKKASQRALLAKLTRAARALQKSRPTFPFKDVTDMVCMWARTASEKGGDVGPAVEKAIIAYLDGIYARRIDRVRRIAGIIQDGDRVLTHCNVSGELAMAAQLCRHEKKKVWFFATETRPYFQGAKLTCWEFKKCAADVTLIADNAVGSLLADRVVNKVIVGSDRSCANGDIANKIGTYQIAVVAHEFGIPVYVLTQPSQTIRSGRGVPIEIRNENELLLFAGTRIAPSEARGFYPAFDIVPKELITRGVPINAR